MTERPRAVTAESPCNKICTVDPGTRLCIGCLRSLDEIAAWGRMSPEERRAVTAVLPSRAYLLERSDRPDRTPAPKARER